MGDNEQAKQDDVKQVEAPALVVESHDTDTTSKPDEAVKNAPPVEDAPLSASDAGPGNPEPPGAPNTAGSPDTVDRSLLGQDASKNHPPAFNESAKETGGAQDGDGPDEFDPAKDRAGVDEDDEAQAEADRRAGRAVERDPVRGSNPAGGKDNRTDVPDELKTDGNVHGGEVRHDPEEELSDEDKEPAEPGPSKAKFAQPVFVDAAHARTDNDALEGHPVDVVSGKHKGRFGVFYRVEEYAKEHGYPVKILVKTFDHKNADEYVGVDYEDVRPSPIRNNRL